MLCISGIHCLEAHAQATPQSGICAPSGYAMPNPWLAIERRRWQAV